MTTIRWPVVLVSALLTLLVIEFIVTMLSFGLSAGSSTRKDATHEPVTMPMLNDECPSFRMLDRDARLEAAYMAGFRKAQIDANVRQAEHGLNSCMRDLMECRHPGGTP